MKNNILVCLLIAFATSSSAVAQTQTPPEGGTPKDFVLPPSTTFSMDNGLSATLIPYGTLPKVTVRAVVRVGNANEAANEIWLCDLLGTLMKEGTTSRSAKQLAQETAKLGGDISISTSADQTLIQGSVLSEFAPKLIELLADIIRKPALPESELLRLKNDQIRQLSISKTDPTQIAQEKFYAELYPNHPYGRLLPTEKMLERYTIQQIRHFYSANFGAARTHVYVAGRFDKEKTEEAIRTAFADWQRGPEPLVNIPKPVSQKALHIIDRPGVPQATVFIGLPTIDPSNPDYRALIVTNALLGGSFGSRITSNIREDKGYTYSPNSSLSSRYRNAHWVQFASVTTAVTGPALKEIFYEIDRLRKELPSAAELKGIQNYLAGVFVLQNSSPGGIINQLSFLNLHGLQKSYLTEYVKTVLSVTPEQVRQMTEKHLRPDEMLIVIAGDKKVIESQVAPFGKK